MGKVDGQTVLTPGAIAIQLDGVQRFPITLDKHVEQRFVTVLTDSFDFPQRMVENEQCPDALIQHRQQTPKVGLDRVRRVLSKLSHNRFRAVRRKVVHAKMKEADSKWNRPFKRYWYSWFGTDRLQQRR